VRKMREERKRGKHSASFISNLRGKSDTTTSAHAESQLDFGSIESPK